MKITILRGDITETKAVALVNPANSSGWMGGGVAGAIKRKGGKGIEEEAVLQAPIPIGMAVLTGAGALSSKFVVHAPTMEKPAEATTLQHVRMATEAALICAEEHDIPSLAMPGMGTGVGGVAPDDAAHAMMEIIRRFQGKKLSEVILIAFDEVLYNAFKRELLRSEEKS